MKISQNIANKILSVLFIFLPIIIVIIYSISTRINLFQNIPVLNDEYMYWREMYSFDTNNFDFGKMFWAGNSAASLGSFYCHGVSTLIAWGWYSIVFNWSSNSIIISNLILITLSLAIFILCYRPKNNEILILCLSLIIFRPFTMYVASSMMEIPCYAYLIIYFSFFALLYKTKEKKYFVICIFVWALVTLLRICYAVVLFPAIMIVCDHRISKKTLLYFAFYIIFFVFLYLIYSNTCAEYPSGFMKSFSNASAIIEKINICFVNFINNSKNYFSLSLSKATMNEIILRYLSVFLIVACMIFPSTIYKTLKKEDKMISYYFSIMLFGIVFMNLMLYDVFDFRDYRVLSPFVYIVFSYQLLCFHHCYHRIRLIIYIPLVAFSLLILFKVPSNCYNAVFDGYRKNIYRSFFDNACIPNDSDTSVAFSFDAILSKEGYYFLSSIPPKCSIILTEHDNDINMLNIDYFFDTKIDSAYIENYELINIENGIGCLYRKK